MSKVLITYQKIAVEGLSQIEQTPLLHQAAWQLFEKSLKIGQKTKWLPKHLRTDIIKGSHGKPYLRYHPYLYFNLSHTSGLVACVIAEQEVGIDIEVMRPYKKAVISKVCTPLEQQWIQEATDPNEAFFKLWTLKESVIKAEGVGLSYPLKQLEFQIDAQGKLQFKVSNLKYHFNQEIIDKQFVLSVCVKQ